MRKPQKSAAVSSCQQLSAAVSSCQQLSTHDHAAAKGQSNGLRSSWYVMWPLVLLESTSWFNGTLAAFTPLRPWCNLNILHLGRPHHRVEPQRRPRTPAACSPWLPSLLPPSSPPSVGCLRARGLHRGHPLASQVTRRRFPHRLVTRCCFPHHQMCPRVSRIVDIHAAALEPL